MQLGVPGTILLLKLDPHGKDIKICLLPWYPPRWKSFFDFNMLCDGREKEKGSLETYTFGQATNSSGVKSPSPSLWRCKGSTERLFVYSCFQWNLHHFPGLQYVALFSTHISVLVLASRGKLLRSVYWWVLAYEWALDLGLKRCILFGERRCEQRSRNMCPWTELSYDLSWYVFGQYRDSCWDKEKATTTEGQSLATKCVSSTRWNMTVKTFKISCGNS